jgi:hypothetical protein
LTCSIALKRISGSNIAFIVASIDSKRRELEDESEEENEEKRERERERELVLAGPQSPVAGIPG